MTSDLDPAALRQLQSLEPMEVLRHAAALRERSLTCADLAKDCLTDRGRQVLMELSADFRKEAERLERELARMREQLLQLD